MGESIRRVRWASGLALLAAALVSFAAPSLAEDPSRQTFDLALTSQQAASTTGFAEAIDYVNPTNASDKPPAVEKVVVSLAPGTAVDTSAPAQCSAPDPVLMVEGEAACPAESKVGGGGIVLDTGGPGPTRLVSMDVSLLNNAGEVIFLFQDQSSGSRSVSRAKVDGATFTSDVPPIPGGTPDGFTAIKTVRLTVDAVPGYITTPDSCPRSGQWINSATFTYRDGASQTVESAAPCKHKPARKPK